MAEETKKKKPEAHVAKYKKTVVEDFVRLIKEYPIIGAINMENMPAPQLQNMRGQLRSSVVILMAKRRLLKIAIERCKAEKKGLEKLEPYLKGMPALLFTKDNPFKLYKTIQKNKSSAPAKAGQIANKDITIQSGPTPFAPGPVISELAAIGLKTGVENGKVTIRDTAVIVKEGNVINDKVASMLLRLGIQPMEIGLDLVAVFENGVVYGKDVLAIDEVAFQKNLENAALWALNLAVEIGYYNKDTIKLFISKAFREAKAVALEGNIMCDLLAAELVEKAEREMLSLKETAGITVPEKAAIEEAKPIEDKKAEAKVEETKPAEAKEKKVWKDVEEIQKEVKIEARNPRLKDIEEIEEKVEKVEEEIKEVESKKAVEAPSKEEVAKMVKKADERKKQAEIVEMKKKEIGESDKLFDKLKKEGTLRNVGKKENNAPKEDLSPQEIIKKALKKS
jgi:large subunit ribosomal protein L10